MFGLNWSKIIQAYYFDRLFDGDCWLEQLYFHISASSEEAGDLAMTSDRLLPFDEYSDNSSLDNIAVSRAVNTACRKAILGQV